MADDEKLAYYLPAGRSLEMVADVIRAREACREKRRALRDRLGASGYATWDRSQSIAGFVFAGEPPKGWKAGKTKEGDTCYMPPRRSKADKALWREIEDDLHWPGFRKLAGCYIDGRFFYEPAVFCINGQDVIACHKKVPPPPDAIPLKTSEYWAMREAQDAPSPAPAADLQPEAT